MAGSSRRTRTVPIFCYHRVCDDPSPHLEGWACSVGAFRRQMRLLRLLRYRGLTVSDVVAEFERGQPGGKAVAITFDDGYVDNATIAASILAEAGFPATVFVVTDGVGGTATWDALPGTDGDPLLSWEQLRDLQQQGWEIGLHSASHVDLTQCSDQALKREIDQARETLQRGIGTEVTSFAYPHGRHSPAVIEAVEAAGLRAAVSANPTHATAESPRYALPRHLITRDDTLLDILLLVLTGRRFKPLAIGLLSRISSKSWRRRSSDGP